MRTIPTDTVFPATHDHGLNSPLWGLEKREYFAALAMQGLCANQNTDEEPLGVLVGTAVQLADALINKLNQTVK